MSPDKSLQTLFNEALECNDLAERSRFLDAACGTDTALRERVEKLLRASDDAGGFFSQPFKEPAAQATIPLIVPVAEKLGDRIGRYKLLQQIGEGGCGVVYMAEQEEPVRRRVALKVIKLGMDTKQVIARFEAERQALALMDHPNIARVHDAGATETGRPYFVMELVRGTKITEFCDQKMVSARERLELFMQVCQAIQHAHHKGIIHRDLKPMNILVTIVDGKPVPKVIDFGIAKATNNQRLTDRTLFTAFEQFIGTPAYMSPEQAEMSGVDIDTRTDIYSLGVVLYELLTGKTPFDSEQLLRAGIDEIRRTIREQEPPVPSTLLDTLPHAELTSTAQARQTDAPKLIRQVRGDLDWIVMKCLEKERARRYETANGLARDVERYLKSEPVVARPPSPLYEFQKTVRRHKFGFGAAAAVMLALTVGALVSALQAVRATRAEQEQSRLRERAEANQKKAASEAAKTRQVATFLKDMLQGVGPSVALGRDTVLLREILDKTADRLGKELHDQPAVEAELRNSIGEVYHVIGEYARAETMHRQALALRTNLWSEEYLEVAQSLSGLAVAVWKGGKAAEAEPLLRRSLAIRTRILGHEHSEIARCLYDLAEVRRYRGDVHEAIALHRTSLAMRRSVHGNEHLEVADSLNRLGSVLSGRWSGEDEGLLRESLAIRRKLLGNEHPDVAEALDNLAHSLSRRNQMDEAVPMHREALAMRRRFFGSQHTEVALSLRNLAYLLKAQGNLTEAEAMFRELMTMRSTLRGYEITGVLGELVNVLQTQGRLTEAEALCRNDLPAVKEQFGNVSRAVDETLFSLARVLEWQGKFVEAEAVWREELAMERKLSGEGHRFVAGSLEAVAFVLLAQNRIPEADEMRRQALALRKSAAHNASESSNANVLNEAARWLATGPESAFRDGPTALRIAEKALLVAGPKDPKILDTLAAAHAEIGDFRKAVSVQKEAVELLRNSNEEADHAYRLGLYENNQPYRDPRFKSMADLASSLAARVLSLLDQGKAAETETAARACLAIHEQLMPDDWRTFNSQSQLGGSLLGQKKYDEAEPLLLSGYEGMKQRQQILPDAGKVRLKEVIERLTRLYEATGQPEKAAAWNSTLTEFNHAAEANK